MGVAYYISTEKELPEIDSVIDIDGKSIARISDFLEKEKIYESLAVKPLEEFFGDDVSEFLDDVDDEHDSDIGGEQWFSAEDGLTTVNALIGYIEAHKSAIPSADDVLVDLSDMLKILTVCKEHNSKWYLAMDI